MNRYLKILLWSVGVLISSVVMSVVYYVIFALLFSSDVEKNLIEENRLYLKYLPDVEQTNSLLAGELEFLRRRDENIYKSVFNADAPAVLEMIESDVILEEISGRIDVVKRAAIQSERAMRAADHVEDCWREVFDSLETKGYHLPPMAVPVPAMSYRNVGASVGDKLSPFYKLSVRHDGLDIIAPAQTPVYATAPGRVTNVQKANGGKGNMVEITHSGGYVTRYAHLSSIKVKKGSPVKTGDVIGEVGDSGRSFTTHLHYEVEKDGVKMDPDHYFFGNLTPEEYLRILIKSASSGQSMD